MPPHVVMIVLMDFCRNLCPTEEAGSIVFAIQRCCYVVSTRWSLQLCRGLSISCERRPVVSSRLLSQLVRGHVARIVMSLSDTNE